MEKIQNNLAEEVLAHHGILGMKWGIRRYQPYPSDYSGNGKYMGKRMEKKLAKIEKKKARHQAKIDTKIKNAVEDGDKKALKKLRDEIEPAEYEKKYEETVQNGIDNAVKDRDKSALKKYKEDMTPREYKHEQDRIEFKEAIDKDKNRKTKKLLSKVDPEDVKEATELIRSRIALQDQKLNKIRQDSELMAKLDKLNSGISKVSKTMSTASSITKSAMDISKTANEFTKGTKEAAEKKKQKEIEKIVRSGNLEEIRKNEKRMTTSQLAEAYNRILQTGSEKEVREAAPFMSAAQVTQAVQKFGKLNELKASEAKPDTGVRVIENFMDTRGTTLFSDVQNSRSVRETSEYLQEMVESNAPIRNLFNRDDVEVQSLFRLSHSDEHDDILAHHGILGMKWGIRRYQPYPNGYSGNGKEVGEAKRVSRSDRKYLNYDVSYAKAGSQYRKKTKYTNIDGSLNEKGKLHAQKYISKQIEKNEKYYAKEIAKYEKKAEKYKESNPEMSQKFKDMIKDAERSRDHVNASIKQMAIDEIMTNESEERQRALKAIKTAAGVTVGAATGGAVLAGGLGLSSALSTSENFEKAKSQAEWEFNNAKTQFKLSEPVDSLMRISQTSPIAAKAENVIENTIRTYSDARAYVLGIGLDQAMYRLNSMGVPQQIGTTIGSGGKSALSEMGLSEQTIKDLNNLVTTTGQTANSIINNPNTAKIINSSGATMNSVLSNPSTMDTLNQLNNIASNVTAVSTPSATPNTFVDAGTIGTMEGLNNAVSKAIDKTGTRSAVTQAYIKSQPDTLTNAQREYYKKNNVG